MVCRLCLEDKKLQRESHIIPQFMYDRILSDEGYFHKIKKDTFKEHSSGKTIKKFQTGEYEANILCAECENEILCQRYEDYAAKVFQMIDKKSESFMDVKIVNYTNENGENGKLIQNIDYAKFKLFLLSILWRANISKRDLFRQVNLGNSHNEALRQMICDGNPKKLEDYPCFICDLGKDQPVLKGTILPPRKIRRNSNTMYEFMISGLLYIYTVSKYGRQKFAHEGIINPNNDMIIWQPPESFSSFYLSQYKKYILKYSQS